MAVVTNIADGRIIMEELFTFGATSVVIIAAVIANIDALAIAIDSKRNFIGEEIFVALCAEQVIIFQAVMANMRGVAGSRNLFARKIFVAMFTQAVMLVQTAFADMNALTVPVDDIPSFGAIVLAFLTELATVVIAI